MKSRLFLNVTLICLTLGLGGCVEDDLPAPPVMEAMDSMEELERQKKEEELARLRDQQREKAKDDQSASLARPLPANIPSSGKYVVDFSTTVGDFTIEVHREWAPRGAHRFYELVKDNFYDDAAFFRVMPGFMVQFGLAADPLKTAKWNRQIEDDPVLKSNKKGYVTFAKTDAPNSRTGQVFINYVDNSRSLDPQGFAPFGVVTRGMNIVERINSEYGQQPSQPSITANGNAYLAQQYPNLDYIKKATVVVDDLANKTAAEETNVEAEEKTDDGEKESPEGDKADSDTKQEEAASDNQDK